MSVRTELCTAILKQSFNTAFLAYKNTTNCMRTCILVLTLLLLVCLFSMLWHLHAHSIFRNHLGFQGGTFT